MINKFFKVIFLSNIIFSLIAFSQATNADNLDTTQPMVNTDCRDVTDYLQDFEFYVQKLQEVMTNLCSIPSMQECNPNPNNKLLSKYRAEISTLSSEVKQLMQDSLNQACKVIDKP